MTGDTEEAELYLAWLDKRTRRRVDRWWYAIEAVAEELLKRPMLSGASIHQLIRQAAQNRLVMARTERSGTGVRSGVEVVQG